MCHGLKNYTPIKSAPDVVVFRVGKDGEVFALFPFLPADHNDRYCTCYQHIGQHGSADYHHCIATSRPASAVEYSPLRMELERIGYRLRVCSRKPKQ